MLRPCSRRRTRPCAGSRRPGVVRPRAPRAVRRASARGSLTADVDSITDLDVECLNRLAGRGRWWSRVANCRSGTTTATAVVDVRRWGFESGREEEDDDDADSPLGVPCAAAYKARVSRPRAAARGCG